MARPISRRCRGDARRAGRARRQRNRACLRSSSTSAPTRPAPPPSRTRCPTTAAASGARLVFPAVGLIAPHHNLVTRWIDLPLQFRARRSALENWASLSRGLGRQRRDGAAQQRGILPAAADRGRLPRAPRLVAGFDRRRLACVLRNQLGYIQSIYVQVTKGRASSTSTFRQPVRPLEIRHRPRARLQPPARPHAGGLRAGRAGAHPLRGQRRRRRPGRGLLPQARAAGHRRRARTAAGRRFQRLAEPLALWLANQSRRAAGRRPRPDRRSPRRCSPRRLAPGAQHAFHPRRGRPARAALRPPNRPSRRATAGSTPTSRWRRSSSRPALSIAASSPAAVLDRPRAGALLRRRRVTARPRTDRPLYSARFAGPTRAQPSAPPPAPPADSPGQSPAGQPFTFTPIFIRKADTVVSWSPKAGCSHVALWAFIHEGCFRQATVDSPLPHEFRIHVYHKQPAYRRMLRQLKREEAAAEPFSRSPATRRAG